MVILLKLVYVLASTPPPLFDATAEDDGLVLPSGISLSGGGGDDCTIVLEGGTALLILWCVHEKSLGVEQIKEKVNRPINGTIR